VFPGHSWRTKYASTSGRPSGHAPAEIRIRLGQEMARERQDVVTALAQWRDVDRDHDQAEVQVLAEPALRHLGPQVAVGSGHRTHVDLSLRVTADALDPALLKGAQQLSLEVAVDLADLVEEERPPPPRRARRGPTVRGRRP